MDITTVVGRLQGWELALNLITVVLLPLELVWLRRRGRLDRARGQEMAASAVQFLPLVVTSLITVTVWFAAFRWLEALVPWEIPLGPLTIGLAIVAADLCYYWEHRAGHRVNALWSLYHSVHHSSPVYDQSTAYRLSLFDGMISSMFYLPLVLAGFPAAMVVASAGLVVAYQTWIHTEMIRDLPRPVEWLFNTASHHRVHHGTNPEYIDRNYGGILIVWDRLFGTFEPEQAPVTYGLTTQIGSTSWTEPQVFELRRTLRRLRRAATWSERLAVLFRAPGWEPAGAERDGGRPPTPRAGGERVEQPA